MTVAFACLFLVSSIVAVSGAVIATPTSLETADRINNVNTACGAVTSSLSVDLRDQNNRPIADTSVTIVNKKTGDQVFTGSIDANGQLITQLPEGQYEVIVPDRSKVVYLNKDRSVEFVIPVQEVEEPLTAVDDPPVEIGEPADEAALETTLPQTDNSTPGPAIEIEPAKVPHALSILLSSTLVRHLCRISIDNLFLTILFK
ncbi:carboxypeptidase-like regulatory domain-containing protein [Halalkalicoccus subterraneus]|uniref:carboxypeptidase-like regulatory domain-containing protein n=1 Tax=Halalkalicoccus subterraneus TaxID=2675002 RepID=UPI0013CECD6D|nr:carboxypeptidase-like regulatory domain-containing protein [Halalkalicoccus subterraneus]